MLEVMPLVGRHLTHLQTRQTLVPSRGIVGSTFPRVIDGEQPAIAGVATFDQVAMPRKCPLIQIANARFESIEAARPRDVENPRKGNRMNRRLDQAAGRWLARGQ